MPPEADIPIEVPMALPARVYAPARRRYFVDLGAPRIFDAEGNELLPPFVPPGGLLARRITSVDRVAFSGWITTGGIYRFDAPVDDQALDPTELVTTEVPPGQSIQAPAPVVILRKGQAAPPRPPARFVPDAVRVIVMLAAPALSRVPPAQILANGAPKPSVEFYPRPVNDDLVGLFAVEVQDPSLHGRYLVRRDGDPVAPRPAAFLFDDEALPVDPPAEWWDEAHGDALQVFAPPYMRGAYGKLVPTELRELEEPGLVLVRDGHPWVPGRALPPAVGFANVGTSLDYTSYDVRRYRQVQARHLLAPLEKRHNARERAEGWIGHHVKHESGNFIGKVTEALPGEIEKGLRSVVRSAAFGYVLMVAATAVSFGAGAPLAQAGLTAAGNAGVDAGGFVGAALPGAQTSATPVGGSAVDGASTAASSAAGSPLDVALSKVSAQLPTVYEAAPVVAPHATNEFLQEAAKASAVLAGFDGLEGVILREAIVQVQLSQRQRDELRVELALLTARVNEIGGQELVIARGVWKAVRSLVLTIGTAGAAEGIELTAKEAAERAIEETALQFLDAAQRALSIVNQLLQVHNERELLRIVEERVQARSLELVARVEEALNVIESNERAQLTANGDPRGGALPSGGAGSSGVSASLLQRVIDWILAALHALGEALRRLFERAP